ncbi:MAG: ATP-dependent RecD-like DNA helicase [Firmicutes bacterium]|nr:ATP-dependent RecD-like DNA helicase [Bacillota bacterium]
MPDLEGIIERIVFENEENGFTVARLQIGKDLVTVVGTLSGIRPGEEVKLSGNWDIHPSYGRQFTVENYEVLPPVTRQGIQRYLGSGLIKGIGPVTAEKIVKKFGLATLEIIEKTPERLQEVEGIGPQKAAKIIQGLQTQKNMRRVMVFLRGLGITPALAAKIYRYYGEKTVEVLRKNPYRLAKDLFGVGFRTADRIARLTGRTDRAAPERVRAGLIYYLERHADEGHVFAVEEEFLPQTAAELGVSLEDLRAAVESLARSNEVRREDGQLYLTALYQNEWGAAEKLITLTRAVAGKKLSIDKELAQMVAGLAPEQRRAVETACHEGTLVITGGPGTGKTTTIKSLLRLFRHHGLEVVLAAPTGRAAKRLAEAAGDEAKTIHRLLEFGYTPGSGFRYGRDENRPLEADVVIIDEVSMVDLPLFYRLLKAVPLGARLILVGDQDQLPPVGPGSVLRDLIASGILPTIRLKTIFRQAGTSKIITNAHRINQGRLPEVKNADDFFFIKVEEPEAITREIVSLASTRLPAYLNCDPIDDIQVLSPMRKSVSGVDHLNILLQEALNPRSAGRPELVYGGKTFRLGDKVMQIRNNYQKMVFNGDMGRIIQLDPEEEQLVVGFPEGREERQVVYEDTDLDELVLSYAISVHKSQGSEYPVVIMPLTTQHYLLLQRNLLYTGVTRAKKMLVLVGTWKALSIAVKNDRVESRNSRLAQVLRRLAEEKAGGG